MCSIIECDKVPKEFMKLGELRFGYCSDHLPFMNKLLERAKVFEGRRKYGIGFRIYDFNMPS